MPELSRSQLLVYGAIAIAVLLVGARWIRSGEAQGQGPVRDLSFPGDSLPGGDHGSRDVVVHVAGAVRQPGVYRLPTGARVTDAVRRAGGLTPGSEEDSINLAARLSDGQQVVVPGRGAAGASAAAAEGPISLGSATADQLDEIEGIGPVTAQKIIEFRDQQGGLSSVDQLDQISGIGPSTMEAPRALCSPEATQRRTGWRLGPGGLTVGLAVSPVAGSTPPWRRSAPHRSRSRRSSLCGLARAWLHPGMAGDRLPACRARGVAGGWGEDRRDRRGRPPGEARHRSLDPGRGRWPPRQQQRRGQRSSRHPGRTGAGDRARSGGGVAGWINDQRRGGAVDPEPWRAGELRRRGIAMTLRSAAGAGGRRAGWARGGGSMGSAGGRRGPSPGHAEPESALARGFVLGEDDRIDPARDDFKRSGLAHLLAVSGRTSSCSASWPGRCWRCSASPCGARLLALLALIALYVPVTGAGPSIQRAGVMGAAGLVAALAERRARAGTRCCWRPPSPSP